MAVLFLVVCIILIQIIIFSSIFFLIFKIKTYDSSKFINHFNKKSLPKCSIILPCKGTPSNFRKNIESFFSLDYSNYEVIFTVESKNDSAVPVIKEVLKENKNGKLVVAGNTKKCCQKNHNLLSAVESISSTDILLFADSDIKLFANWIKEMIMPLSDDNIYAVTGFRWLYSKSRSMGSIAHSFQNYIMFGLFSLFSSTFNIGLWGGSTAIRKIDFDKLGVRKVWSKTSVDDMSLSQLLQKKKKKVHFSFNCVTPTSDTINTFFGAIKWFHRQVLYLKYYQKFEWFLALFATLVISFLYLTLPLSILAMLIDKVFLFYGGSIFMSFIISLLILSAFFPVVGKSKQFVFFVLLSPLSLITILIGVISTIFTNTMEWSGIKYKIRFRDGIVTKVIR